MSGSSDTTECPRCDGRLDTYNDWKPFDVVSGLCLNCGFNYATVVDELLTLEIVNNLREEQGLLPLVKLATPLVSWLENCKGYEPEEKDYTKRVR